MIITESKFKSDTKSIEPLQFLFDNFSKGFVFKKDKIFLSPRLIFISYKHGENDYVFRLKELLDQYGFHGYIDYEDDTMPKETSGETAQMLKSRIVEAKKFFLIATNAAINSKWCNWEIGFGDTHKYIDNLGLLCISPDIGNYDGTEYLQIYPTIQVREDSSQVHSSYYVNYPDGTSKSLKDWLQS